MYSSNQEEKLKWVHMMLIGDALSHLSTNVKGFQTYDEAVCKLISGTKAIKIRQGYQQDVRPWRYPESCHNPQQNLRSLFSGSLRKTCGLSINNKTIPTINTNYWDTCSWPQSIFVQSKPLSETGCHLRAKILSIEAKIIWATDPTPSAALQTVP